MPPELVKFTFPLIHAIVSDQNGIQGIPLERTLLNVGCVREHIWSQEDAEKMAMKALKNYVSKERRKYL